MAKKTPTGGTVVRYIGDGTGYVPGVPANPDIEQEFDAETAAGLVETGLFEYTGSAPAAVANDGSGQEEAPE